MLGEVLKFLKDHLNHHLRPGAALASDGTQEEAVVFVDGEKIDPINFKLGAVSVLLINVEEDNSLRPSDPYLGVSPSGETLRINPEIRMNLYVLFVARYKQYESGLAKLSDIIRHFQTHRVFDRQNSPELGADIEKLILELVTLPLSEQNELWNALRTTYHPSVLYKVRMVVFRDSDAKRPVEVSDKIMRASQ